MLRRFIVGLLYAKTVELGKRVTEVDFILTGTYHRHRTSPSVGILRPLGAVKIVL